MRGETRERWLDLCAQIAQEQDRDRLMELIKELNRLLDEKEKKLGSVTERSA